MKSLKKLLLVAVAAVSFAACGSDEEENTINKSEFVGSATSGNYTMDDVKVLTTSYSETKKTDIVFDSVTFAPMMPKIQMKIEGVDYTVSDGDTVLTANDLQIGSAYTLKTGKGKITQEGMTLEATVVFGGKEMDMSFNGRRK